MNDRKERKRKENKGEGGVGEFYFGGEVVVMRSISIWLWLEENLKSADPYKLNVLIGVSVIRR